MFDDITENKTELLYEMANNKVKYITKNLVT